MATISGIDGIAGTMAQQSARAGANKNDKDVSASDAFSSLLKSAGGMDFASTSGSDPQTDTDFNRIPDIKAAPSRSPEPAVKRADSSRSDAQQNPAENAPERKPLKADKPAEQSAKKQVKAADKKPAEPADKAAVSDTGEAGAAVTEEIEEVTEEVTAVISGVIEILKEALSVDDGELSQMLEESGVSMDELLTPEGLKDFILEAGGHTGVDLLVDENLAQTVNDAVSELAELLEENGVTDTAAFADKVAEAVRTGSSGLTKPEESEERPELVLGREKNDAENVQEQNVNNNSGSTYAEKTVMSNTGSRAATGGETGNGFLNAGTGEQLSQQTQTVREDFTGAMNNLNQAVAANPEAQGTVYVEGVGEVRQSDIISQVIDEIKASAKGGVESLEVVLNPEQLGKVHINVVSRNGVMQAQITAETEAAKNAIEQGIVALKENLEQQGLKVEEVEVMLEGYEFFNEERDAELEEKRGGRKNGSGGNRDEDDTNEGGNALAEDRTVLESRGSSVSYTA